MKRTKAVLKMTKKLGKIRNRIDKLKGLDWFRTDIETGEMDRESLNVYTLIEGCLESLERILPTLTNDMRKLIEIALLTVKELGATGYRSPNQKTLDEIADVLRRDGLIYQDDKGDFQVTDAFKDDYDATCKLLFGTPIPA